jgi:hypothetical protein
MKRLIALISALVISAPVLAGSDSGADFLKIPIGSRGVAMGQAYTALSDESDALNWNTAALAPLNLQSAAGHLSFSHEALFLGNMLDHISVSVPKGSSGFGLSITRLSYPTQEARDENRTVTGNFGASDLSAGLAYAANYSGLRIGTQVKYLQQSIANQNASGFAVDLGLMSPTPMSRLNVGASIRNLGPSMQFVSERFSLPLILAVGGAYQVAGPLVLALDVQHRPRDRQTVVSLGSEFSATGSFSLRAGYLAKLATSVQNNQQSETNRGIAGGLSGLNAGFGLRLSRVSLDYAVTPFGELGDVQSLTVSTAFGGATAKGRSHPVSLDSSENPSSSSNGSDGLGAETTGASSGEKESTDQPDAKDRKIIIFDQPNDQTPWGLPK